MKSLKDTIKESKEESADDLEKEFVKLTKAYNSLDHKDNSTVKILTAKLVA